MPDKWNNSAGFEGTKKIKAWGEKYHEKFIVTGFR